MPATDAGPASQPVSLPDTDARILEIERGTWRTPGAKALAIRAALNMTETRYYQLLSLVIDTPEALRSDPALVRRLRERRARRLEIRAAQLPGSVTP